MTHVVVKALSTGEGVLAPGTKVDASAWRNRDSLESLRYIKPIPQTSEPDERVKRVGRDKDGTQSRN